MSLAPNQAVGCLEKLVGLEATLLERLEAATGEFQRIECLDEEQRAEIHTIIEAMKHDVRSHVAEVRAMTETIAPESTNA